MNEITKRIVRATYPIDLWPHDQAVIQAARRFPVCNNDPQIPENRMFVWECGSVSNAQKLVAKLEAANLGLETTIDVWAEHIDLANHVVRLTYHPMVGGHYKFPGPSARRLIENDPSVVRP
jgi:hypothetical protein